MGRGCFLGLMCWRGTLSKGCMPAAPAPCMARSCFPLCRTKVRAAQGRVMSVGMCFQAAPLLLWFEALRRSGC